MRDEVNSIFKDSKRCGFVLQLTNFKLYFSHLLLSDQQHIYDNMLSNLRTFFTLVAAIAL